jgi:PAS domain S-box-containing protein
MSHTGGIQTSEDPFRQAIDLIPALAWSSPADGTADFFNRVWLDYTGLTAEQAMDWGWTAAIHPDDFDRMGANWQSVLAARESGEIEARLRRFIGDFRMPRDRL